MGPDRRAGRRGRRRFPSLRGDTGDLWITLGADLSGAAGKSGTRPCSRATAVTESIERQAQALVQASAIVGEDTIVERDIVATHARRAAYAVDATFNLVQKQWQSALRTSLPQRLPNAKIHIEGVLQRHAVDVIIEHAGKRVLVELKTASTARQAIREAVGLLPEYCYRLPSAPRADVLLITAAEVATAADHDYLALLRERFRLPLCYLPYRDGCIDGIAEFIGPLSAAPSR